MFEFERLIDGWARFYYSPIIMFATEAFALFTAIKYARNSTTGRLFLAYITFDSLIYISDDILGSMSNISLHYYNQFLNYTNTAIGIVELVTYFYFFYKVLSGKRIRRAIVVLGAFYLILSLIYLTTQFSFFTTNISYVTYALTALEFIFLVPFCLIFYNQLLNIATKAKMLERPSFWIVTGIFFYSSISIPCYLLTSYMILNYKQYFHLITTILFYIPFTINFLFLSKAFLCKRPLTT